jgi:ribosomal protein S18 acetylase RimI-like enzyme
MVDTTDLKSVARNGREGSTPSLSILHMNIRKAELKDFETILQLNKELVLYEQEYLATTNADWSYTGQGKEYFSKRLVNENSIFHVVEDEGNIVGYVLAFIEVYPFRIINPICIIENIFVREPYRRQGIGSQLVKLVKDACTEKKVQAIRVTTYTKNDTAVEFYKKHGLNPLVTILEQIL